MQHFINRAAIGEPPPKFIAALARAIIFWASSRWCVRPGSASRLATIWFGVALLVEESSRVLRARLTACRRQEARAAHLGLDIASASIFAAAPAMAWYSRAESVARLGHLASVMLATNTAFSAKRGRLHAIAACAPYGALTVLFLLELAAVNAAATTFACLLVAGYAFAAALQHAHRAAHERMQDAEWVRQLNMSFSDTQSAAWELDFAQRRLVGGYRLAAVLGRPVTFDEILAEGCFATPADRAMVASAFSPESDGRAQHRAGA